MSTADLAAVFVALYAGHQVADHWLQTQHQADNKGKPGWSGRWACVKHVSTYGLTQLAALALVALVTDLHLSPTTLAAGMAINLASHYIADRRTPLRWLAELAGVGRFYTLGAPRPGHDDNPSLGTGAYALDQSWHIGWLFVAALIIAA
ncbi:DUF3307 domain-containing protein [Micromonospora maritima]|uniref:DUF3307 domain-containing protein n=1 Tax=Micromonospora maritima TaxID=986711 RepID=UPI00157D6BAC|nr:DUF3307 domain-containing protein [Micromonospora maritima]